ncbi:MAG: cytochrome d ubiquinol oxidase subunit II [Candidatus Obscuribacterales bacterium]|nr:cytochrome d ubiquinol oxidase subunit II [Candidatus Obscuribacterales bacterium]
MPILEFTPEIILGLAMIMALTFYAVMAGADYGGGVWDLLAFGPRAAKQRETIANAIGPIWEANHVWLILVVVILFSCFPPAFAAVSIALHIPLTLLLFGIVLRGSAFTFRTYDSRKDEVQRLWGRVFAISSTLTPVMLGIIIGAISNGDLRTTGPNFYDVYISSWWQPFPIAVGLFALTLFAYLAAVYLTSDTEDQEVQNDFRIRALLSAGACAVMAAIVFFLSRTEAPGIWADISRAIPLHVTTFVLANCSLICLIRRKFLFARYFAAGQVAMVLWGWAIGQYPYLVRPEITIVSGAANRVTLHFVIGALVIGALLLFPSFYYLLRIFKTREQTVSQK